MDQKAARGTYNTKEKSGSWGEGMIESIIYSTECIFLSGFVTALLLVWIYRMRPGSRLR